MTRVLINDESLKNIANAIRNKNGSSESYKPNEMAEAIENITTGSESAVKFKSGTFTLDADATEYTMSGLGFRPKLIIVKGEVGVAGVARTCYWVKNMYTGESITCAHKSTNAVLTTITTANYSSFNEDGFHIKRYLELPIVAGTYNYIALTDE